MNKDRIFVALQRDGVLDIEIRKTTRFLLKYLSTYYSTIHSNREGFIASVKWLMFGVFRGFVNLVDRDANDLFEFVVEHRREIEKYGFPENLDGKVTVRLKRTKGVKLPSVPANRNLKSEYFAMKRKNIEETFGVRIKDD